MLVIDVADLSGFEDIKTINSITDVTQIVNSATLTAAGVVAPHDPGSVTASMLAKMLQYSRYLDIDLNLHSNTITQHMVHLALVQKCPQN